MKPLLLEIQAFGPFAKCERVDFTALGAHPFFLIHGPTGAGKTTLLDAICFALYGDTSGGERDATAMRSDHAEAVTPTRVMLEFSLGQARYRVERSPTQARPKHRGTGSVQVPAKAQLDRWDGGAWKSLDSQPMKVNARNEGLLGFSSEQFRQVVVLPQGRFRELLSADSAQRQKILEHLFQTALFRRVEEALKDEAATLKLEARDHAMEKRGLLAAAQATTEEELAERAIETALAHERAGERARAAKLVDDDARFALQIAREISAKRAELDSAQRIFDELAARAAEIENQRDVATKARRALHVRAAESAWRASSIALRDSDDRLVVLTPAAQETKARAEQTRGALAAERGRAELRQEAARRVAMLVDLETKAGRMIALRDRLRVAGLSRDRDTVEHSRLLHALAQKQADVAGATDALVAARMAAAPLQELRLRQGAAEDAVRRVRELEAERTYTHAEEVAGRRAEAALEHATSVLEQCRSRALATEDAWHAGQTARLATLLRVDEPCPVCGSAAHPQPARADVSLVSDGALATARKNVRDAETTAAEAGRTVQTLHEQRAATRARIEQRIVELGTLATTRSDELEKHVATLADTIATASAAQNRIESLNNEQAAAEGNVVAAREALEACDARRAARELDIARMQGELATEQDRSPAELRDPTALGAAIAAARAELDRLEQALQRATLSNEAASRAFTAAEARQKSEVAANERLRAMLARDQAAFDEALRSAHFPDVKAYSAALRSPEEMSSLERALADHDTKLAAATDRLERARVAAHDLASADVTTLEQNVGASSLAFETAIAERQAFSTRLQTTIEAQASLAAMRERSRETERRFSILGRLAEVANGDNPRRITFQRFVLASLLDEVLEAASLRLRRMSRNRYELLRITEEGDQRIAGGLDIDVLDHHTGTRRPGSTLSGGEGFLASLALALGLADVVQSRAGGIQMETLFVDEGFGSLDPESLDFAIRTLVDLQQTGRMVGIISHVAELTERIDARLDIVASARGSTISLRLP